MISSHNSHEWSLQYPISKINIIKLTNNNYPMISHLNRSLIPFHFLLLHSRTTPNRGRSRSRIIIIIILIIHIRPRLHH
ncbi:hypothetical protein HanRHA438_Chr12g0534611 [Helianthus annuus]|nr:hypothetical protein HanRHA438_Chr12g0534611 [Helianthus annuus]